MDADLYPPDIVTLRPSRVQRRMSEDSHSPLSSTPNSPRGEHGNSRNDVSIDEDEQNVAITRPQEVAPFDENTPDDEKKTDEKDELMRRYNYALRGNIKNTDDDSNEPPSLTIHSSRRDFRMESFARRNPRKPTMLRQRAKTTGDIRLISDNLGQKYLTSSPTASFHEHKPNMDMQQHLKFAALKRDIVSVHYEDEQQEQSLAYETEQANSLPVAVTPVQNLKSPPKVVKKQMWNSDPSETERQLKNIVSPSPNRSGDEGVWPSFYDNSFDADEAPLPLNPKTTFSMASPHATFNFHRRSSIESYESGDIPLPTASKSDRRTLSQDDSENAYHDHSIQLHTRRLYSEDEMEELVRGASSIRKSFSHDSQPDDEAASASQSEEDQPDDEKLHPWSGGSVAATLTPRSNLSQGQIEKALTFEDNFSPFHPQGAVRLSTDESEQEDHIETQPSQDETDLALLDEHRADVHGLLASALSDAVGFAATGAAAMGDFAIGAQNLTQPLICGRPTSLHNNSRAVSEIEPGHQAVHPEAVDWVDYLRTRGVNSKSISENGSAPIASICANWINSNNDLEDGTEVDENNSMIEDYKPPTKPIAPERYREATPKKDLQTSEKSAAWLQEEFKRRSIIKKEINDAILERSETPSAAAKKRFAEELTKALEDLQEGSQSTTDDEVAALTTQDENPPQPAMENSVINEDVEGEQGFEMHYQAADDDDGDVKPEPRRLEFCDSEHDNRLEAHYSNHTATNVMRERHGSVESSHGSGRTDSHIFASSSMHSSSNNSRHSRVRTDSDFGRTNPVGRVPDAFSDDPLAGVENNSTDGSLNTSLQVEMQRFVNDTRAALRRESSTGKKMEIAPKTAESNLLHSPFRSLAISNSDIADTRGSNAEDMDLKITYPVQAATYEPITTGSIARSLTQRSASEGASSTSEFSDMQNTKPALIHSMDSMYGIAKGDITLSLLNENTGQIDDSRKATWANRVHGAIWRCRRMRRKMGGFVSNRDNKNGSPRRSLPVDLDRARVAGGFKNVASTQDAALSHLRNDEIEEAIELFEDIIFAYYSYFERTLKARELNPGHDDANGSTNFKPYIGVALHNLGILHLLNGDYQEALSFFSRAVENRKSCLGEGHRDHVVSLSRLAICHYALDEFGEAHSRLEEALEYASQNCQSLEDRVHVAEILNNLGCLAYMCGQPAAANAFFRDSLDVHFRNLSESLYETVPTLGQSISLDISITRANIGFVKLVTKELPLAITALENALMEQQILLQAANETVIATMDHLAVANLLYGDQLKAAQMFGRVLVIQQNEYGPHDRRCYITRDKINMVQSQGEKFEMAIEELRKTFSMPALETSNGTKTPAPNEKKPKGTSNRSVGTSSSKNKGQKNKMLKVFGSIRKKK